MFWQSGFCTPNLHTITNGISTVGTRHGVSSANNLKYTRCVAVVHSQIVKSMLNRLSHQPESAACKIIGNLHIRRTDTKPVKEGLYGNAAKYHGWVVVPAGDTAHRCS